MRNRRRKACIATAAMLGWSSRLMAVSWNATDTSRSAITATGLVDKPTLFVNENVVNDTANSTRGTGTYLGDGWVLTAQHVLTGSGNIYGTLATPGQISMTVSIGGISQNYTADALSVPSSADIGLIHLAGTTSGPITMLPGVLKSAIQTGTNENDTLVQLGGYGYYGPLAGALSTDASFHRAFNITTTGGSAMNVPANGSSRLVNNGYVMGIGESGDSGSGLWMDTGADADTNLWDYNLIGALATTSNTNAFGSNNQYSRISSNSGWLLSNAYSGHATVTWDANSGTAGIQEGSGIWNLSGTNFGNGVDNVAWDNSTTKNAFFGAHKGTAGTVTLGANVSVQNMMFNPAVSGTYTIAAGAGFSIAVASNSVIMSNADANIAATISGSGVTLTKLGPAVLTLSGSNTVSGTVSLGNSSTTGGNLNGSVRIASSHALDNITQLNWTDNNSAHDVLQLDGGTANGNVTVPASVALGWGGNNDGPSGTAATMVENIAGSNTLNGPITGNVGGIGYGIAVDSGSLTLGGNFTPNPATTTKTFYLRGPGNGSFTGTISGSAVGIIQTGSGTWTLNSLNSYGGMTTLAGGVLSTTRLGLATIASGIGNSGNGAGNLVLSGGTLQYMGTGGATDRLFTIGAGGATLDASGSGTVNFFSSGSTASSDAAAHASITAAGSNVVTLTGGGFTDLAAGMTVTGAGIPAGATISSLNFDVGTMTLSASATAAGTPTLSFGLFARTLTLKGSNAGNNTLSPKLVNSSGGGALGVTKTGGGLWILSALEGYTGATLVSQGTLTLNSGGSLASINETVSSGAIFNINGSLPTATNLVDDGTANMNTASQTIATLNGGGALNLKATSLTVGNGGTFSGAIAGSGSFNSSGGTMTLASSGSIAGLAVTVASTATLNVNGSLDAATALTSNGATNFGANGGTTGPAAIRLGSLNVGANGLVTVGSSQFHSNRTVLVSGSGTISGTIDLKDNDFVLQNTDAGQVELLLKSGFNAGAGYWNGHGIVSTTASGNSTFLTALGYRQSDVSLFDTVNTTTDDTLVKYTYYGDADLSGFIDGADYQQIDNGFGLQLTGWFNGDFNYDGIVDGSDFALIDNTFNQLTALGMGNLSLRAEPTAAIATQVISVPEPSVLGIAGLCMLALQLCRFSVARRRRLALAIVAVIGMSAVGRAQTVTFSAVSALTSQSGYAANDINACSIDLNNLITVGNFQYIAYYSALSTGQNPVSSVYLGRRAKPTAANLNPTWTVTNSGLTMPTGVSGSAGNALADDHNVVALGVDSAGDLHLAYGMHNTPLSNASGAGYYISATGAATGATWTAAALGLTKRTSLVSGGANEDEVTYPDFYNLQGSNDLLFSYRQGGAGGGSGNGDQYFDRYTPGTNTFTQTRVVDGEDANVNAYLNSMVYTSTGNLLMSWTWRASSNWQTNSNIMFAQSPNNGVSWYHQGGTTQYMLPITPAGTGTSAQQAQVVWNLPQNTSFINQTSMTVDAHNNPMVGTYWAPGGPGGVTNANAGVSASNNPNLQYMLVYYDGTQWRTSQVSHRTSDTAFDTSAADVRDLGRPIVMVDGSGRVLMVTRSEDTTLGGFAGNLGLNKNNIVAYYNTTAGLDSANPLPWQPITLDSADMGQYEPTYDSALWASSHILNMVYEPAGVGGSTASKPVQVLQWDEPSYFASATLESVFWDSSTASAGVQDGGGTWNTTAHNFSDAISNYGWVNSTTQNVIFGVNSAPAGTVTLGADITVKNITFNAASSGIYNITGSGSFKLTLASGSTITNNANGIISASISSAGLVKLGTGTLILSGNNSALTGTLSYGTAVVTGGNVHGAVRVTSAAAAGGLTLVNLLDNNGGYAVFQLDGSGGSIVLPSTLNFSMSGTTGTNLTANLIENIAGNNQINGKISINSGGSQYAVQSDAGTLEITSGYNLGTLSNRFLDLQGEGNGLWSGVLGNGSGSGALAINKYGGGTWALSNANTLTGPIAVNGGSLAITGSVQSTSVTVATGATLSAAGSPNDGLVTTAALNISGTAVLAAGTLNSGNAQRILASVTLNNGGVLQVANPASHADLQILITSGLTLGGTIDHWQGVLDLTANDMIVRGGDIIKIGNQLKEGINTGIGYWNGAAGILSSTLATDTNYIKTLGYRAGGVPLDNITTFGNDVLVKYTYYGDADLNGVLNGADYQLIDAGFGNNSTGWSAGDFNYDGTVNGSDFALIDNAFNQISATNAKPMGIFSQPTGLIASGGTTVVPEPDWRSLAAGVILAASAGGRHRRKACCS